MAKDGDMRMLGVRDGYIHAIADLRQKIGSITYYPINPRHTRKLATREAVLKPLRELDKKMTVDFEAVRAAYLATTLD